MLTIPYPPESKKEFQAFMQQIADDLGMPVRHHPLAIHLIDDRLSVAAANLLRRFHIGRQVDIQAAFRYIFRRDRASVTQK